MLISLVDLEINNISSVLKSLNKFKQQNDVIEITGRNGFLKRPDLIILPGVGNFGIASAFLSVSGLGLKINELVDSGSRIIGICLGMQLLLESSQESPGAEGLGLISGQVVKFRAAENLKVPNVGWSSVKLLKDENHFPSLNEHSDFYFVHSYFANLTSSDDTLATADFGSSIFPAAVSKDRVLGVQFHPEKSGGIGSQFIRDALNWARHED